MNVFKANLTHQAETQLREIIRYIVVELHNPDAAENLLDEFEVEFAELERKMQSQIQQSCANQTPHQPIILIRQHKADSHEAVTQKREGGAIPDHHPLPDGAVEEGVAVQGGGEDFQEHEVRLGAERVVDAACGEDIVEAGAFCRNQLSGAEDVVFVGKHDLSGGVGEGTDHPRAFVVADFVQEVGIAADGVTEPQAGRGKEFAGAAQDDDVVVVAAERHRGNGIVIFDEFDIGFVDEDENVVLLAGIENAAHIGIRYRRAGRVVGIAEDDQVNLVGQPFGKFGNVQQKIFFLTQWIIMRPAADEGYFPFVFGVSWSENQRPFRMGNLNKQ